MNKAKRFMIEYANWKIGQLEQNKLMNDGIRRELERRITKTVSMYQRGMITVDETMKLLAASDTGEDMSAYMT